MTGRRVPGVPCVPLTSGDMTRSCPQWRLVTGDQGRVLSSVRHWRCSGELPPPQCHNQCHTVTSVAPVAASQFKITNAVLCFRVRRYICENENDAKQSGSDSE